MAHHSHGKLRCMNANEYRDIVLPVPRSNLYVVLFMGIFLPIGVLLPFLAGWQLPVLGLSLFLSFAGIFFLVPGWKLLHTPVLVINEKGVDSLHPWFRCTIMWDEIDAIYSIGHGIAFAVDLSPAGLVSFFARQRKSIPPRLDMTVPQLALSIQAANLPLPVDQLLAQIREYFPDQLERYHIDLDDGHEAEKGA